MRNQAAILFQFKKIGLTGNLRHGFIVLARFCFCVFKMRRKLRDDEFLEIFLQTIACLPSVKHTVFISGVSSQRSQHDFSISFCNSSRTSPSLESLMPIKWERVDDFGVLFAKSASEQKISSLSPPKGGRKRSHCSTRQRVMVGRVASVSAVAVEL